MQDIESNRAVNYLDNVPGLTDEDRAWGHKYVKSYGERFRNKMDKDVEGDMVRSRYKPMHSKPKTHHGIESGAIGAGVGGVGGAVVMGGSKSKAIRLGAIGIGALTGGGVGYASGFSKPKDTMIHKDEWQGMAELQAARMYANSRFRAYKEAEMQR